MLGTIGLAFETLCNKKLVVNKYFLQRNHSKSIGKTADVANIND